MSDADKILRRRYPRRIRRTVWKRLRVLWLLWCLSRKYPDQRFGQIVENYVLRSIREIPLTQQPTDVFYVEDWDMIEILREEVCRD